MLVVDDEVDILELIELTLLRMGLDVERAMNVKRSSAKLADATSTVPDRYALPDGTGIEIVEHITKTSIDLPVAVITAHGNTENAVAALKAGAFDYLAKPVGAGPAAHAGQVCAVAAQGERCQVVEQACGRTGLLGELAGDPAGRAG